MISIQVSSVGFLLDFVNNFELNFLIQQQQTVNVYNLTIFSQFFYCEIEYTESIDWSVWGTKYNTTL